MADQPAPPMDPRVMAQLLMQQQAPQQLPPVDPQIAWNRAGAMADSAYGFNDLQRMLGLNLSPRAGIGNLFQSEVSPQNRIQESFYQLPGYR